MRSEVDKKIQEIRRAQQHRELARYYNLNSIYGNDWAMFYVIIGGRKTGKSYSVAEDICRQKRRKKDQLKVYWMRISETSTQAMLANKANKLIDPDLVRKYNLDLSTKSSTVYNHGEEFMEVLPLSKFGKLKGVGFYDKDFEGEYLLILDEFQLEQGEKRTCFNILYNFIGMCENIARTTKKKIKVLLLGNTLEEASTILKAFNFLPEKFGRFYLKSKRCVIDNIEPTEEYLKDRKGSIADILGGDAMSNYTNELMKDVGLIKKDRVKHITAIIKFSKHSSDWYSLWDGKIIRKYKGEKVAPGCTIAMLPYLDDYFSKERRQAILDMYDARSLFFDTLITKSYFQDHLATLIRK